MLNTLEIVDIGDIPNNFTGKVSFLITEEIWWFVNSIVHREDGPAKENLLFGPRSIFCLNGISYLSSDLNHLISDSIFLKKEKGNYNLEWLRFLTDQGIQEFPIIPGMDLEEDFKLLFEKLSNKENPT